MDMRQLRAFVAVARSGSFTAASRALNLSQPALGLQVKALEERLGVVLLVRHSRGARLTEAGRVFLEAATQALDAIAAAERSVARFRHTGPMPVTFGVAPTPGRALLPALLDIAGEDGTYRIMARQGLSDELIDAVISGELDAALCYDPPALARLSVLPLSSEDLFLVGPPQIMGTGDPDVHFDDLEQFQLVLDGRVRSIRRLIDRIAVERGRKLDLVEAEPANVKREMIMHHGRCTVVPYGLFFDEIDEGRLVARRIVAPTLTRQLVLLVGEGKRDTLGLGLDRLIRPLVSGLLAAGGLGWRLPGPSEDVDSLGGSA